jgi:hypothetical protein
VTGRQDVGESEVRKHANTKGIREQALNPAKNTHLENLPQGTPVDPQRLVQIVLTEAPWSRNSCHNAYSAWASLKWAGGMPA